MPSRWFLPITVADPHAVKLEHLHAAISAWFDWSSGDHGKTDKPYTISPLTDHDGLVGVELATLSDLAETRLVQSCAQTSRIRLGSQSRDIGQLHLLRRESYEELLSGAPGHRWQLDLVTPTTFRRGDRSSPLPAVSVILSGLQRSWNQWSGTTTKPIDASNVDAVWVSDLDLTSAPMTVRVRRRDVHLSCATGVIVLRCDDPGVAASVAPLLRFAQYSGIGSMRGKGLGVVRVREFPNKSARASAQVSQAV